MQHEALGEDARDRTPTTGDDRRSGMRLLTVYRAARISAKGDHGLVRVLNLSDDGVQLSTRMPLAPGDEITLDFSEKCSLAGQVVWHREPRCGIRFTTPLDSVALLRRLSDEHVSGQVRQLRLSLTKAVVVRSELGIHLCHARDISQRGLKVLHNGRLGADLQVAVQITPDIVRHGFVRWSGDGIAGIMLSDPLSVDDLGSINAI